MPNAGLTHFDEGGAAIMVDVSGKEKTHREAIASGRIYVSEPVYNAIEGGTAAKGDVLGVARIAGIMAAKRTSDMIPLCHPLPLAKCTLDFALEQTCRMRDGDRKGHGRDGRRDGGAARRKHGTPHHLRHVQGDRQAHGDRRCTP